MAKKKEEYRCDPEQIAMLLRCSVKKDTTEWNEWRMENITGEVWLEGAWLEEAHLWGADLREAHLEGAGFPKAHLEKAVLEEAYLERTHFMNAHLEEACLVNAHLEGAIFWATHLQGACLGNTRLEGTSFEAAHLEGAEFETAFVDGFTQIWNCYVDRETDFSGVALESIQIDPATKQLLEYNIRRDNWEEWYDKHPAMKWLVRPFWWVSDYGLSTGKIVLTFFLLAGIFAWFYFILECCHAGAVDGLTVKPNMSPWHAYPLALVRSLYFSIVTMTTVGFGDIHANPQSILGHVLIALQVLLGYTILGALITRFAVLFTAGGPAGKFSEKKSKKEATDNGPPSVVK